jgi:ubiquitin C-terminal hydrolase
MDIPSMNRRDITALYELPRDAQNILIWAAPFALKKHNEDNDDFSRALNVLATIGPKDDPVDCNKLFGMDNEDAGCFIDATLFALLAIPTRFTKHAILEPKIKQRQLLLCGKSTEEDVDLRTRMSNLLRDFTDSMRGLKDTPIANCTPMRQLLSRCYTVDQLHEGAKDASEFLSFILNLFPDKLNVVKNVVYVSDDSTTPFDINNISPVFAYHSTKISYESVIHDVSHTDFDKVDDNTNISSFLNTIEDVMLEVPLEIEPPNKRRIEIKGLTSSPFTIINIRRTKFVESQDKTELNFTVDYKPIIPDKLISIGSSVLKLYAAVLYHGPDQGKLVSADFVGHYTSIVRCGDEWYHYDDLRERPKIVPAEDSHKEMMATNGVLFFYSAENTYV